MTGKYYGLIASCVAFAFYSTVSVGCLQREHSTLTSNGPPAATTHSKECDDEGLAPESSKSSEECCGKCESADSKLADRNPITGNSNSVCQFCKDDVACKKCQQEDQAEANHNSVEQNSGSAKNESSEGKLASKQEHTVNSMRDDRDIFHFLLRNHSKISRKVTVLKNGVKTVTESEDPKITGMIQDHVYSMKKRVEQRRPLRMWDELFREIFKHSDKIEMKVKKTDKGVEVIETSKDPYVAKLIQEHAKVVTGFTKRGFDEAHENHKVPSK